MDFKPSEYKPDDFAGLRHIGPSPREIEEMLEVVGTESVDSLVREALPEGVSAERELDIGEPLTERQVLDRLRQTADKNKICASLIGMGYYGTETPPAILRNVLENPAWYTAYTPYQPEISQGRLEILLNFQTMVCDLTGLDAANASLLDEATACGEAVTMARRISKSKCNAFFVDRNCHPQNIAVMRTRAEPLGIDLVVGDPETDAVENSYFGAVFQYPGTHGIARDLTSIIGALKKSGAVTAVATDLLALTLLKEPGEMGADIAVGSTQRFGMPLGMGGPHAAFMSCRQKYIRELPGRIVGVSLDARGRRAYRLALQTREQHIRREKAKSNICTAQVLPAVIAAFYAIFHGPRGLRAIAERVHFAAADLSDSLAEAGYSIEPDSFFDTFTVDAGSQRDSIVRRLAEAGINVRVESKSKIGISVDEITSADTLSGVCAAFGAKFSIGHGRSRPAFSESLQRTSQFLAHPVFHMNRSESEMVRYMRRLADRDLALDRTMIPLGSCTMKLNSATEMIPITWPEFGNIHPFAPSDQTEGYRELFDDLSSKLCRITGFDAISFQPNSGAQGEFAGLMTIRAFHRSKDGSDRRICLIPSSAHGTNAASANMAGMDVVEVRSTDYGKIDLEDFRSKARDAGRDLAATMVTYPSTYGVFEDTITEVAGITHEFGGQVYLDGANLNALVGIAKLAELGADVSHLNLHKTFCIPHGGGGPGMGPIGVKAHLKPYLPGDPLDSGAGGAVSAAMNGSPSILPVSWAYILLMGNELAQATKLAILNANYIAARLGRKFPIQFVGSNGRVAHECIIDLRPFAKKANASNEDVAKRLIDSGFHPPTMSWPVPGTLMIEPTESEPKAELDRFCDAMLAIREEIDAIENGRLDEIDNPLKNSPHTVEDIVEDWTRGYSREAGVFPPGARRGDKYWPPVNRIDNVYGDRNIQLVRPMGN
ncbi:MAG: aminomethyl-transferring glycine dehydrogenase [Albidovulum sp.]|nr:aminomethyl-transferring glycine dehydrogenase [Albidovulum sp.]